jgi:hypothetical protein
MLTTVWIHRALSSDILVRFNSRSEASFFCADLFAKIDDPSGIFNEWGCLSFPDRGNCFDSFVTPCLQVSIHDGAFHHVGWAGYDEPWAIYGTVLVSPEEAIELGELGEPEGFIPGESENGIWTKNTKSLQELNEELDQYQRMRDEIEIVHTLIHRAQVHRTISSASLDHLTSF